MQSFGRGLVILIWLALWLLLWLTLFLGIAIWPWGGASFFDHPARLGIAASVFAMMLVSLFARISGFSSGKKEDRRNRWVFIPFVLGMLGLAWLPSWSDKHDWWTFDGNAARYAGLGIAIIGGFFRVGPMFTLGRRFSPLVAIQENHTLETRSFYRFIRHPNYLGILLFMVGWALVFRSGAGLLFSLLVFSFVIPRINAEEKLLANEFGAEYESYRKRTWRLIPFLY